MVRAVVSTKQRKRELDKNNKKLLNILQDCQTLKLPGNSFPPNRGSKSQTIILARRYGGAEFIKATNLLLKIEANAVLPSDTSQAAQLESGLLQRPLNSNKQT